MIVDLVFCRTMIMSGQRAMAWGVNVVLDRALQ
jgi:hypothetical protein